MSQAISPKLSSTQTKPEKKKKRAKKPTPSPDPTLDKFEKQQQEQVDRHLRMEQRAQLWAQEQLHRKRISEIHQQLQMQLFKMWNEMWLQRQKTWNDSHKAWLKVFMA